MQFIIYTEEREKEKGNREMFVKRVKMQIKMTKNFLNTVDYFFFVLSM